MGLRLLHFGKAEIVPVFNVCLKWSVAFAIEVLLALPSEIRAPSLSRGSGRIHKDVENLGKLRGASDKPPALVTAPTCVLPTWFC